jgi:hypothetical protein
MIANLRLLWKLVVRIEAFLQCVFSFICCQSIETFNVHSNVHSNVHKPLTFTYELFIFEEEVTKVTWMVH